MDFCTPFLTKLGQWKLGLCWSSLPSPEGLQTGRDGEGHQGAEVISGEPSTAGEAPVGVVVQSDSAGDGLDQRLRRSASQATGPAQAQHCFQAPGSPAPTLRRPRRGDDEAPYAQLRPRPDPGAHRLQVPSRPIYLCFICALPTNSEIDGLLMSLVDDTKHRTRFCGISGRRSLASLCLLVA